MRDVMIDLETMGTTPGSAIVSIGACFFDRAIGAIGDTFEASISLKSCVAAGLTLDPDTVMWWLGQSDAARGKLTGTTGRPLADELFSFAGWLRRVATGPVRPWGNAASFDCGLLAEAYRAAGMDIPWKFWDERCYRTLKEENKHVPYVRTGIPHHALSDAISQAQHACAIAGKPAANPVIPGVFSAE